MKKTIILSIVIPLLLILINGCGVANYTYSNNDPENVFPELAFYGQWINIPSLGEVWEPDAAYNWGPFVNGQWQFTDRGWMWDSTEPYGWIVYHYGEWAYTDSNGWVWVPGYVWYPSRVKWMQEGDYIGWSPIPPAGWNLPADYYDFGSGVWTIVHKRDFDNQDVGNYRIHSNSFNNRRDWTSNSPAPGIIRNESGRNFNRSNTVTENIRRGHRNLTRVRIINPNVHTQTSVQAGRNRENINRPEAGREQNRRQAVQNARINNGERNAKLRSR
jgi:hypothetical protein